MTGFGRAAKATAYGRFTATINSLNRKHLEVRSTLPHHLVHFEADLRRWIGEKLHRGQVSVRIDAQYDDACPISFQPNIRLLKEMKAAADSIATQVGIPFDKAFNIMLGTGAPLQTTTFEENDNLKNELCSLVQSAVTELVAMRDHEGAVIQDDLLPRVDFIAEQVTYIDAHAPKMAEMLRTKILDRLGELAGEYDDRLAREVALYADKADITEELTRLKAHTQKFREAIAGKEIVSGKSLEFRLQEMGRETNTIGAKVADQEITERVLTIKTELERLREQLANVE